MFIVFEGIDGSGKTTQASLLAQYFTYSGIDILSTREPGGTDFAKDIRDILLYSKHQIDPKTQLLLILAARRQHYYSQILPALKSGRVVICDRFIFSTIAYQGYGLGIDLEFINNMHKNFDCFIEPDITIILDSDVESKFGSDNFEKLGHEFLKKVAEGYRKLAENSKNTFLFRRNGYTTQETHKKIVELVRVKKNFG